MFHSLSLLDSLKVLQELSHFLAQGTTPFSSLKKERKEKGFKGSLYRILLWENNLLIGEGGLHATSYSLIARLSTFLCVGSKVFPLTYHSFIYLRAILFCKVISVLCHLWIVQFPPPTTTHTVNKRKDKTKKRINK